MTAAKPKLVELAGMVSRAREALQGPATEAIERALDAIKVVDGSTEGERGEALEDAVRHAREVVTSAYGQLRAAETVMWTLHHALMEEQRHHPEEQGESSDER